MLRCPRCTSLLPEGDVKRCPACGSKIRRRSQPTAPVESSGLADRPMPLVERELRARIEAKTAAGFRRRRRAAKVARRIAALPSTVLEGDLVLVDTETEANPPPTSVPTIIDLPAHAVHDRTSTAEVDDAPAEPEAVVEPEPVVVPEAIAPEVVEPEVVEPEVVEPEVILPEVVEAEPVEEEVVVPEVVVPEVLVPEVVVPEVVEPEPAEPVVVEPEIIEAVPTATWQRSSSLWTDRVFNTAQRNPQSEAVVWPSRWKPAAQFADVPDDSDAEAVDVSKT
jgi:hypothetical protein